MDIIEIFTAAFNIEDAVVSQSRASGLPGTENGPEDLYRHLLLSAEFYRKYPSDIAAYALQRHEGNPSNYTPGNMMDIHNNNIGKEIGSYLRNRNGTWEDVVDLVNEYMTLSLSGQRIPYQGSPSEGAWSRDSESSLLRDQRRHLLSNGLSLEGAILMDSYYWNDDERFKNNNWPDITGQWLNRFDENDFDYDAGEPLFPPEELRLNSTDTGPSVDAPGANIGPGSTVDDLGLWQGTERNDRLWGESGLSQTQTPNDTYYAAGGHDEIYDEKGDNYLDLGQGNDKAQLFNGDNIVAAGPGNDRIDIGRGGNSVVNLGTGDDVVDYFGANNPAYTHIAMAESGFSSPYSRNIPMPVIKTSFFCHNFSL